MTTLSEGDLRLTLPEPVTGRKFDGAKHDLSHCMKAVDWILDLPERTYFVEIKDPDAPSAKDKQRHCFFRRLLDGELTTDLVAKLRDSFLYEWACDRVDKPISYYVIIASDTLDAAQFLNRTDDLKRRLPVGKRMSWNRAMAHDCRVFNIAKWNDAFPEYPLSRHSASGPRQSP